MHRLDCNDLALPPPKAGSTRRRSLRGGQAQSVGAGKCPLANEGLHIMIHLSLSVL